MYNFTIKANTLEAIHLAASTEDTRYYLCGILFEMYKGGSVGMVATDGHILAHLNTLEEEVAGQFILGSAAIKKILGLYKTQLKELPKQLKSSLSIRVSTGDLKKITLTLVWGDREGDSITCEAVDGNFPAWRRVIPDASGESVPQISFNSSYIDLFGKIFNLALESKLGKVILSFTGQHSPIHVTSGSSKDGVNVRGLLMPMRA